MMLSAAIQHHEEGAAPGAGTYSCLNCGSPLSLEALDRLPECPRCGGAGYRRASMFDAAADVQQQTTTEIPVTAPERSPEWLEEARAQAEAGSSYLAYLDDEPVLVPLAEGWTRIGRSIAADLRLDDPTVSRRHALLVLEEGSVRVLDDRSLNGVFLNGDLVEWGRVRDGDELLIGRYRLYLIQA